MFSGLVRGDAHIKKIDKHKQTIKLTVSCSADFTNKLAIGDSIAIDGTCLTVESFTDTGFIVTMMPQTYKKTIFKNLHNDDQLNVERSLEIGQRLEGHLVTGHVDDLATVIKKYRMKTQLKSGLVFLPGSQHKSCLKVVLL